MIDFKSIAQECTSLSPIMENRGKMSTEEVLKNSAERDGLTIIAADVVPMVNKQGVTQDVPVVVFAEYPDKFYFGGYVLNKIVSKWLDKYGGDTVCMSDELKASGGVKMTFTKSRTKGGNDCVVASVV